VADAVQVPMFELAGGGVNVLVRARDVGRAHAELQRVGEAVGESEGRGAVDGAQLLVIGGDLAYSRAASQDAGLVLVDVLQREIERELSLHRAVQSVQVDGARRRAAARVEPQRDECKKKEQRETMSHGGCPFHAAEETADEEGLGARRAIDAE